MKKFVFILLCFSGLLSFSQKVEKVAIQKNTTIQDSIKKPKSKNSKPLDKKKIELEKKLDSISKVDIELVFEKNQQTEDSVKSNLKPFKTNAVTSYYADKFHGRRTASGQVFDNKKYTAAHKKLPFGTRLKVTNEANGKSVEVIVNDRGPFTKGRELDLSKVAFLEITRDIKHGLLRATIEIIEED